MVRVKFSDSDGSNEYTCTINPVRIDVADSDDVEVVNVLDGSPARLTSSFDDRIRILEWDYFSTSNTRFSSLISELKTYKGQDKRINLEDIGAPFGLNTWKDIKILNVETNLRRGGNLMQNMVLTYVYR